MTIAYVPYVPHRLNRRTGELEPLDISALARHADDKRILCGPNMNPFKDMNSIVDELHVGLETFTKDDYLVLIGNPAIMSAMVTLASRKAKPLKLLQWHGKDRKYNEIVFDPD